MKETGLLYLDTAVKKIDPAPKRHNAMTYCAISTAGLKHYTSTLSPDNAFRQILALEKDEVPAEEFFARPPLWLALAGRSLEE